jgi:hypothetical protein
MGAVLQCFPCINIRSYGISAALAMIKYMDSVKSQQVARRDGNRPDLQYTQRVHHDLLHQIV